MAENGALDHVFTRRRLLGAAGAGTLALTNPSWAETMIDLPLPGSPGARPITTVSPQKGPMILQRTRPPLLETPFEVFDKGVFTPNDQSYLRWHWAVIPTDIDIGKFSLTVRGGRVSRGINIPNAPPDPAGLASVNPIFTWVRLAQLVPMRIHIDQVPDGLQLVPGMTATVQIDPQRVGALTRFRGIPDTLSVQAKWPFLASVFGLTGQSERNLINVVR
jgi:hypothetical protein